MHLPLLLSCDTVLQKRKPWPNLHWIGEDERKVYQIARHLIGEVDLHSGSSSRVSQLCSVTKVAAAVNYTYDGSHVYGIMTSGDLFFWNQKLKSLSQAQGIPDLVTHIPHSANRDSVDGPLQSMLDLLKHLRPQSSGSTGTAENAQSTHSCSMPPHHKPNIFASNDCSKVVVVLGASQIHLWERDVAHPLDGKSSSTISGHWSVVVCPTDVPLPALQSRETQISSCFLPEGSLGNKCQITFSFIGASCLVITTLTLQWGSSGNAITTGRVLSAYWNSVSVTHQAVGMKETEMLQKKGTLISRYAHGQSLVSIAVNSSQQQCSKLLYLHPYCNTAVVISVCDAVYQESLHNANISKSHWVSDLTWSRDDTFIVGCLRSGAIFVATRMGPLAKISCTGKNLELQPTTILPLHPLYDSLSKEVNNEEASLSSESFVPSRPTFCVSCHPLRDQFLLSSGLRVSVLALPENGRRDVEVVDQLLSAAKHALYLLQNSSLTHDYAYIRCSTWKLAQSVLDLSKNFSKSANAERCEISLWDKKNPVHEECNIHTDNHADEGERLIEQVMKPLLAAWTLISSYGGPQTNDWKGKPMHVAKQLVKLVNILMQTSMNDDYSEHQAMLLQMLHIFHHFVKVLAAWPKSLHMVKPTLWLTHQIIHAFLRCEKHAGESSMVYTLLILTQTLSSLEGMLAQVYDFRPVLQIPSQLMYNIVGEAPGIEVTNITTISSMTCRGGTSRGDPAICLRMKKLWVCLYLNSKKVYLRLGEKKYERNVYQKFLAAMNIIQSKLQRLGFDLGKKKVRLDKCDQLYLNGLHLAAIKEWKFKIIKSLPHKRNKRKIGRYFHSVLYAYLLHKDFIGISDFLSWLYILLKSNICTKNQSSLPNKALSSTPKPKKDSHILPQELLLDISHITQEMITTCTQEASEGFVNQQSANQTAEQCESLALNKDNRHTHIQKCNHSVGGLQNTSSLINVVRQVIGSLGRIMAEVILQHDIYIPSPHSPHIIPPIWDHSSTLRDRGITPFCSTLMKGAIHSAHWSSETAAQALAIAGYWYDITTLSQGLGDTKTALLSSLIANTIEKSRIPMSSNLHPSTIVKDLVLQSGPIENLKASVFHSLQELMQVASMSCLEVIPNILQECLEKIQDIMQHFEVFVPSDIYLPAPPVFCPQVTSALSDVPQSSDDIMRYGEGMLRKKLAGWVRLFCSVISAAGIAQPLLLEIHHIGQHQLRKVSGEYNDELDILAETLGPVHLDWTPHGPEWSRIIELWHRFLSQLWILHARDKLSLCLRKFTGDTSSLSQRNVSQGTHVVEILSWVQELHKVTDVDTWKDELISTALTAASNAPPNPIVAQGLAYIIPKPTNLSSLLKDKAIRLFEYWKKTDVVITEVREETHEIKEKFGRHKSLIETYTKLYNVYDRKCAEVIIKGNIHKVDQRDFPRDNCTSYYNEKISDISSDVQITSETVGEEFRRFGFLLASMTFARDAEMFPQHFAQIPQLVQFSDVIKKREFQGLRIRRQLFQSECHSYAEHIDQNTSDYADHMSLLDVTSGLVSPGKKGLFRNLVHSKISEGGVKTVFHFHNQTFLGSKRSRRNSRKRGRNSNRNHSLSPLHRKHIVNQRNQSSLRTKETDLSSSNLKPEHFARRRLWYKNSRPCSSESRSRSHSSSMRERGTSSSCIQSRRSRSTSSIWFQERSKSRLLDLNDSMMTSMNQNPPLNCLLYLSKFHSFGIENEVFQEMTRLIHWLMSSERRLCPPSTTNMRIDEHSTVKKIDLSLEDIVSALKWEYLSLCKFHTHPKKDVIPSEHRKKPSAEIIKAELLENKDVKKKQNFTVKQAASSHNAVISDIKVKDHEEEYTSIIMPDGTKAEYAIQEEIKEKTEMTSLSFSSSLRMNRKTGEMNTPQTFERISEKEDCVSNQRITTDIDGKVFHSQHENNYKIKTDVMTPLSDEKSELSSSQNCHISSCNRGEVPGITTEDQQDGKAAESMSLQNNDDHDPPLEESCKALESNKTKLDLNNGTNKDCSYNPQNATSAFKMTVQDAVREELKNFFQVHPLGLHALTEPSHSMSHQEVCERAQVDNSPEDINAENGTFIGTSIMSQEKSDKKIEETVMSWNIKGKRLDKDKKIHQKSAIESVAQYSHSKNAWESLKARNGNSHNPKPLIIEVKEVEKLAVHHKPMQPAHKKKESLTPIEKPSQIINPDLAVSLKLLHVPPEIYQESKKLSIADLCEDEDDASLHSQSVAHAIDDTLDDVTLPDSLHISDLDENYRTLSSQNIIQENNMKSSKFNFSKKDVTGEASSKLNRTVTLKKPFNQKSKQHVRWDQKELVLKSLPIQIKTASANVAHNLGKQSTCGPIEPQSFIERNESMKKTLKLLTLPKQSPKKAETMNDYPPLLLKQLPINKALETKSKNKTLFTVPSKGISDYLSDKQSSKHHTNFSKEVLLKDMALLTIPTCSYSQVKECRATDSIHFLDPKQVFNYYAANMIKRKQHRFRTLRINEPPKTKNFNETYEKKVSSNDQTANKRERPKFDVQENIDKGFLDGVKEYAEKYETGAYKDLLVKGNSKTDGTVRSRFQYEATQKMDKVYQSQYQHFKSSKEIQTLPQDVNDFQRCETSEFKDTSFKRNGERSSTDEYRFQPRATKKINKHYQSQSQHIQITRETQTLPQELNEMKRKTFSDHKTIGVQVVPVLEEKGKEAENKHMISFRLDQRTPDSLSPMKSVETRVIKTKDSWTETDLMGSRLNLPLKIHEAQTQTPVRLTRDTSVTARITPSYQPQSYESYSPSCPLSQENFPVTRSTLSKEDFPSSPCPKSPHATPATPTFNSRTITHDTLSQPSKGTHSARDMIHIVDSPHEVVQQQLEEIHDELNKTKCSLDHENVVQEAFPSSSAALKIERHASTVEEVRNGKTVTNSEVKEVDDTDRFQTNDSSFETNTYDTDFKQYEGLRNQNIITRNMDSDILQTDFKEMPTNTELAKDELHSTNADFALERGFLGSDKIMMNELIEAFSHGRITFEDLCKMSSNIQMAEEEENLENRNDNDNIERLEQQTVEAAQSLRDTRNLMSKLNHLLEVLERLETERINAQRSTSSGRGFQYSFSAGRSKSSFENLGWQETLTTFTKNGDPDTLLRFIEDTNPEDLTVEMIDEITNYVETSASKHSTHFPSYSQEISIPHSKTYVNNGISRESYENVKMDVYQRLSWIEKDEALKQTNERISDRISNQPANDSYLVKMNSRESTCRTEDYLSDSHAIPELHLDLSGLRSGSSSSFPCTSYQSSVRQHGSSLDLDEKRQNRRAEIRTWMKKRRKKMEQAEAVPQNTITKTQLNSYRNLSDSKRPAENALESTSTIKVENQRLSGKQLLKSSQEREERRNLLRQDHRRKREEDVLKLFTDHEEELMTHRNLFVKKQTNESPKIAHSNESQHRLRLLSAESNVKVAKPSQKQIQANQRSNRKIVQPSFARPFKSRVRMKKKLSEVKACFTDNTDILSRQGHSTSLSDDLSSLSISPFSCNVFSDRNRTYVVKKMKVESDDKVHAKLDSLVKCLRSSEKGRSLSFNRDSENKSHGSASSLLQMKGNHGKKCEKRKSEQRPYDSERSISVNDKRQQEKSDSEAFYQISSTLTLPLDRISEVDSNVSADSLPSGGAQEKESLPRRPNGEEDTSSESSWNVPDHVKSLLNG